MAWGKRFGDVVESDSDAVAASGLEWLGRFRAVTVGKVEQSEGHAGRFVIGGHIGESDGDHRHRLVDAQLKRDFGRPENFDLFAQGIAGKDQRSAVLFALVVGKVWG